MGFTYNYSNEYAIDGVRKKVSITSLFNNDSVIEFQVR